MMWLINQLPSSDRDFDTFVRPDGVERVFGRGYTSADGEVESRERARAGLVAVLPSWFSAASLSEIEAKIVAFIVANEGEVTRPTAPHEKANVSHTQSVKPH